MRAVEQRDAADEGRLEPGGSAIIGTIIVNQNKVVRPSQLIASVRPTRQGSVNLAIMWPECASRSSCHLTRGRPWQRFRPILGRRFGTESRFTFGTTRRS